MSLGQETLNNIPPFHSPKDNHHQKRGKISDLSLPTFSRSIILPYQSHKRAHRMILLYRYDLHFWKVLNKPFMDSKATSQASHQCPKAE